MARELDVPKGSMRLNAHLYAPIGGWVDAATVDGEEQPARSLEHHGHPVSSRSLVLDPGGTRVLTWTVITGLDQPDDVRLRVTPGVRSAGVGHVDPAACRVS
jgi:hypothetical protein